MPNGQADRQIYCNVTDGFQSLLISESPRHEYSVEQIILCRYIPMYVVWASAHKAISVSWAIDQLHTRLPLTQTSPRQLNREALYHSEGQLSHQVDQ